jgi:hypothetical protein
VSGNVFLFAAGDGPNWDKTITRPIDLQSLADLLGSELQTFLEQKVGGGQLFAWGAPIGAIGTIAGMAEDDVVFGSRQGVVGFAGQVALSLKDPSDVLSTRLWGAPTWPYVYFLYRGQYSERPVPDFLAFIGERGRVIQGFRVSHKASDALRSSTSALEFVRAALGEAAISAPQTIQPSPGPAEPTAAAEKRNEVDQRGHAEAEADLIRIGEALKLSVWVAPNDRSETVREYVFRQHTIDALPFQAQPEFHRRIALIDVLWLRGPTIMAAFEVEHSTAVYSGLLRMLDLVSQFPNLSFPLFIVAPDADRRKVCAEIRRPSFQVHRLAEICQYIPYSRLRDAVLDVTRLGRHLSPAVIGEYAEPCE